MTYEEGKTVRIDANNAEWGRVCGTAEILYSSSRRVMVNAHDIRANIWISKSEAYEIA